VKIERFAPRVYSLSMLDLDEWLRNLLESNGSCPIWLAALEIRRSDREPPEFLFPIILRRELNASFLLCSRHEKISSLFISPCLEIRIITRSRQFCASNQRSPTNHEYSSYGVTMWVCTKASEILHPQLITHLFPLIREVPAASGVTQFSTKAS